MIPIVIPKDGKLLELRINEKGALEETGVYHNPRDYSSLGTADFQHTIRLDKRTPVHPDIKKEYYSKLQSFASTFGANLFQIVKESTKETEPQDWGVSYETMILMYVK